MKVNEFRHGLWRRPDMQETVVLIEVGDVTHVVHRAVVSGGYVVLVAGSVVAPPEPSEVRGVPTDGSNA